MEEKEFDQKVEKLLREAGIENPQDIIGLLDYWRICAIANTLLEELYKAWGGNKQRVKKKLKAIQGLIHNDLVQVLSRVLNEAQRKGKRIGVYKEIDKQLEHYISNHRFSTDLRAKRYKYDPELILYWYEQILHYLQSLPREGGSFNISDLRTLPRPFSYIPLKELEDRTPFRPGELAEEIVGMVLGLSRDTLHYKTLPRARKLQRKRIPL